jgi:phenol 2-monooxygenase (NADPH)
MAPHAFDSYMEMAPPPPATNGEDTEMMQEDTETTMETGRSQERTQVCVVGAGPAGLMLACLLARFGIEAKILDERPDQTACGRADGIQPKTIETMRMMGVGTDLMRIGKKIYDICIWGGTSTTPLRRIGRETHYPDEFVDLLEPYILISHQGMIEKAFLDDLEKRGKTVSRCNQFLYCTIQDDREDEKVLVQSRVTTSGQEKWLQADYVVGCDGAHSIVRDMIMESPRTSGNSVWGVLDGEIETDFPDIYSKCVMFSEEHGSILIIPREKNMTRFYIEMKETSSTKNLGEDFVMQRASNIFKPYTLKWKSVEWFGRYQVSQRVAPRFADPHHRIFIAGDASHTHSPKAAQGMNTSVHDTWNLGWKLNLAARGLAKPLLLQSYEEERQKIGKDLIEFDYEHANQIAGGDAAALAENFRRNIGFISGVGAEYSASIVNQTPSLVSGAARPGCNLPPAKVTRYIDANPVDVQLDIPVLGQFRVYLFAPILTSARVKHFMASFSEGVLSPTSFMSRITGAAQKSYEEKPRFSGPDDVWICPHRFTKLSELFTYSLISKS